MSLLNHLMEKVEDGTATGIELALFKKLSAEYMDYGDEHEVKRWLVNSYVEFTDGTYGKYDATTDGFVPVQEDELFQDEDAGFSLDVNSSLEEIDDFLHGETDDELRRKAYFLITCKKCPKWWHAVVSACIHSMELRVGFCPIRLCKEHVLPITLAEKHGKKKGAKRKDFDAVYRLLVEMQWDLLDGTNVDVVHFLLNEWECLNEEE